MYEGGQDAWVRCTVVSERAKRSSGAVAMDRDGDDFMVDRRELCV